MHGGKRKGAGRPNLGRTKKCSITLPEEIWEVIDKLQAKHDITQSELLRDIIGQALHFFPHEINNKRK